MTNIKIRTGLPRALPVILGIAIVSLITVLMLDSWLDSLGHPTLARAADLVFDISVAYIVAYIFYYLTIRVRYERELPGKMKYVSMRLGNILRMADLLRKELNLQASAYNIPLQIPPTARQIDDLGRRINPQEAFTQISDAYNGSVNWFDAINIIFAQINESKQEIILLSPELDIHLIGLLDEITDCSLTRIAHMPRKNSMKNISGWELTRFFDATEKIRDYKSELDRQLNKKSTGKNNHKAGAKR